MRLILLLPQVGSEQHPSATSVFERSQALLVSSEFLGDVQQIHGLTLTKERMPEIVSVSKQDDCL